MDRALWLLLRLRLVGYVRRWGRNVRSPRGLLLTLVGMLLFAPLAGFSLFAPRLQLAEQLALTRRYGGMGLLAFCLVNVILASEERAVYYSPAEVDFLFSGPFRRRELLLYKIAGGVFSSLLNALVMTFVLGHHANAFLPAFVGLFLMIELMVLIAMAVSLSISTVGALAFNRSRKLMLVAIAAMLSAMLLPRGRGALALTGPALLGRLEDSTIINVLTWPFRPAVMAFTANNLWPELAAWSLRGVAVLLVLGGAIVALEAEFYEATAAASKRVYARLGEARLGRLTSRPIRTRWELPMLPWWGGAGPALWRQLSTAAHHPDRIVILLVFFLVSVVPAVWIMHDRQVSAELDLPLIVALLANLSLVATMLVGFDFRADLDRLDVLKALPVPVLALVIGEMTVPVLLLTSSQWICLGLAAGWLGNAQGLVESLLFLPLYNGLLVEIESLLFLWFPIRIAPGMTMDVALVGRQILLTFAAFALTGVAAGSAMAVGALIYYFLVSNWAVAVAAAWLTMMGFVVALTPLVVAAFQQFDVARDTPP
jgi:hypothetical protein